MNWDDLYKKKVVSPDEAMKCIKSGDGIYVSANAATPKTLLKALADRCQNLNGIKLYHVLMMGEDPLTKVELEGRMRHVSLFVGPADREAVNDGRSDYVPIFLHEIPQFIREYSDIDVALIHTSPPDEHGFLSLGVEVIASKAAVEKAKVVIAQVNEKMPRTHGDTFIHVSKVHKIVEVSEDLFEIEPARGTPVEKAIGEYVANVIEDGSTLQLGIGGIPNAVLESLRDKKDLGIHTEMVSDGIMKLIEEGIINGAKKTLHRGKVVATFLLGTRKLYEYANDNPIFEMHPVDYTNDPYVIAQNEKMVSVNSAIEIDITGQVCADSIGTYIYSGFGGQLDFVRGAAKSKGGKPIIAMPSTAKNDTVSRIVPELKTGAGVVTTRADVHYVATEFGIVNLHGKTLRERAELLIGIAHPNFRDELRKAANRRKLIELKAV
ncbi:MAG: acetyl-CoA hydrolase/transferase C-terminal domain-containing protein [Nitrososphaerota archaeon]